MCSKLTPPRLKAPATTLLRRKETAALEPPARKTRSKTRKPKYLSLRLELSPHHNINSSQMTTPTTSCSDHHQQLTLFPLHPENLNPAVEVDKLIDTHEDHNMATTFFSAADDDTTLTGLLGSAVDTSASDEEYPPSSINNNNLSASRSPSINYRGYGSSDQEQELVRTAMRRNNKQSREEKWVCYSEVVEKKEEVEVSSRKRRCAVVKGSGLSLKLDYDEIMNAWCDKGPLYIHNSAIDSPQTVPDLHDEDFLSPSPAVNGLWRVPEMSETNCNGKAPQWEGKTGGTQSQREASMLRYKEKRHNRLFAKKIRYQVRKLNAEKRPRVKGRFVKRS